MSRVFGCPSTSALPVRDTTGATTSNFADFDQSPKERTYATASVFVVIWALVIGTEGSKVTPPEA